MDPGNKLKVLFQLKEVSSFSLGLEVAKEQSRPITLFGCSLLEVEVTQLSAKIGRFALITNPRTSSSETSEVEVHYKPNVSKRHYVATVIDKGADGSRTCTLFVDGATLLRLPLAPFKQSLSEELHIFSNLAGSVCDVGIWDLALTQAEVFLALSPFFHYHVCRGCCFTVVVVANLQVESLHKSQNLLEYSYKMFSPSADGVFVDFSQLEDAKRELPPQV